MLGDRRLREEPPDQRAELLELRRLPEVNQVRLDALPADQEMIPPLGLHAALQLVLNVARDALEDGLDLRENSLEFGYVFRLDVQDGDFENHAVSFRFSIGVYPVPMSVFRACHGPSIIKSWRRSLERDLSPFSRG